MNKIIIMLSIIIVFLSINRSFAEDFKLGDVDSIDKNNKLSEQVKNNLSEINKYHKNLENINNKIKEQNRMIEIQSDFFKSVFDKWNFESPNTEKAQKDRDRLIGHVGAIDSTILLLSIIITIITVFIVIGTPFFVYYLEQKRSKENDERMKWFEKNTKSLEEKSSSTDQRLEQIYNEIDKQFKLGDTLSKHMESLFKSKIETFETDYKSFKDLLINSLDQYIKPIEERKISAEEVRYEMFQNLKVDFDEKMKTDDYLGMKSIVSSFFEFNYAIESILSDKDKIKFDGLARLVEKVKKEKMPFNVWELIKLLKKQNRLNDIKVTLMLQKASQKFDWPYEELSKI